MYSSVPTSTHSLSKKWKQLIKFYLDLFSMDESKEPDLCNIRVDRLGTTIIFLYSFFYATTLQVQAVVSELIHQLTP